jgi:hypothetical protein
MSLAKKPVNLSLLYDDTGKFEATNHCIPVLEVFPDKLDSTYVFIVMPFLPTVELDSLKTVGNVINLVSQILLVRHSPFLAVLEDSKTSAGDATHA